MVKQDKPLITVEAVVAAPIAEVWECWTKPEHITKWNFASSDWQCPSAANDLWVGGKFTSRMEAKDGSAGFDFSGVYTEVAPLQKISYIMDGDDARRVETVFAESEDGVVVTTTFEVENVNPLDMQRGGWQSILNNFKKYVTGA